MDLREYCTLAYANIKYRKYHRCVRSSDCLQDVGDSVESSHRLTMIGLSLLQLMHVTLKLGSRIP